MRVGKSLVWFCNKQDGFLYHCHVSVVDVSIGSSAGLLPSSNCSQCHGQRKKKQRQIETIPEMGLSSIQVNRFRSSGLFLHETLLSVDVDASRELDNGGTERAHRSYISWFSGALLPRSTCMVTERWKKVQFSYYK